MPSSQAWRKLNIVWKVYPHFLWLSTHHLPSHALGVLSSGWSGPCKALSWVLWIDIWWIGFLHFIYLSEDGILEQLFAHGEGNYDVIPIGQVIRIELDQIYAFVSWRSGKMGILIARRTASSQSCENQSAYLALAASSSHLSQIEDLCCQPQGEGGRGTELRLAWASQDFLFQKAQVGDVALWQCLTAMNSSWDWPSAEPSEGSWRIGGIHTLVVLFIGIRNDSGFLVSSSLD